MKTKSSGTLIFFAPPPRGYGFIKSDDGDRDVFIHMREVKGYFDPRLLVPGVRLFFDVVVDDRGPKAVNVRLTPDPRDRGEPPIMEMEFDLGIK